MNLKGLVALSMKGAVIAAAVGAASYAAYVGTAWLRYGRPSAPTPEQADALLDRPDVRGLVAVTKALGWGVLAEIPGREIVMGAVTQPWEANVVFRSLAPDEFAAFKEPGYVKIIWTLRADSIGSNDSIARTDTRAIATDAEARGKFRWYWARFSPGIVLIRAISLRLVRKEAEHRVLQRGSGSSTEIVVPPAGGMSM